MDDADPNGGNEMEVQDPEEIDHPLDHVQIRKVMPFDDSLPLAAEDVPWSWNVTTQDEVLGEGLDNWDRYAMAHFYMDENADPETKAAYKLPFCLMINGELQVVLKGLYAVMAVLNGARGGVDISDDERQAVYSELSKYYNKFGLEAPELMKKDEVAMQLQEKSEKTIQNITDGVILEKETSSTDNTKEDRTMNDNDMKALASLIQNTVASAVSPVLERVSAIEEQAKRTSAENVEEKKADELPTDVAELRAMLKKTQDMLVRTMQEPVRVGRHQTVTLTRGVGAESALGSLAERSAQQGAVALASIVNKNIKELSEEQELSKISVHAIKELLTAGLRAALVDGLLAEPNSSWS